jgi:Zn-finger nucleic acid-binding protein
MSACPFCSTDMQGAFSEGLLREECEACGALWIEGEMLEKVVGHAATDGLLRQAKGKPGQCKGCQEPHQYVPNCPKCGLASPTCPQCHTTPLPVAEVSGVKVDVCTTCRGIGLDAGELEQLRAAVQAAVQKERLLELERRPQPIRGPDGTIVAVLCATCARKLKPQHAFTWDDQFYCGSCAPSEAAPYDVELTKADPSALPMRGNYYYGSRSPWEPNLGRDRVGEGIAWLFSKILG